MASPFPGTPSTCWSGNFSAALQRRDHDERLSGRVEVAHDGALRPGRVVDRVTFRPRFHEGGAGSVHGRLVGHVPLGEGHVALMVELDDPAGELGCRLRIRSRLRLRSRLGGHLSYSGHAFVPSYLSPPGTVPGKS